MRKKQFLAYMLTGSLVLGMMPGAVFAEESFDAGFGVEAQAEMEGDSSISGDAPALVSEIAELTPTAEMQAEPTEEPTQAPTEAPAEPTVEPTQAPTEAPVEPTVEPTQAPTEAPAEPTVEPTQAPTEADGPEFVEGDE